MNVIFKLQITKILVIFSCFILCNCKSNEIKRSGEKSDEAPEVRKHDIPAGQINADLVLDERDRKLIRLFSNLANQINSIPDDPSVLTDNQRENYIIKFQKIKQDLLGMKLEESTNEVLNANIRTCDDFLIKLGGVIE
jgi:hypothetical protein